MDIVYIRDLEVETIIGVYAWERRVRQRLRLNLELAADARTAAARDELGGTVDYAAVAARILAFAGETQFQLVETMAERLAELLIAEFGVEWLRLDIAKAGAVREARAVGVVIERRRADYARP
jgi:7,8-dihydroneopterin aldolase/epimerase/oxygenase